jgi:hypothetical protein
MRARASRRVFTAFLRAKKAYKNGEGLRTPPGVSGGVGHPRQ